MRSKKHQVNTTVNHKSVTFNHLKDDELLIIFSYLDLRQQFTAMAVSRRWNRLVQWILRVRKSLSFVDDTKDLSDWHQDHWYELTARPTHYERVAFNSVTQLVSHIVRKSPNLKSLDMECFTINSKAIDLLATNCLKLERLNLDSSTGFTPQVGRYFQTHFDCLKYLNVSCVSDITESFVSRVLRSKLNLVALNICGTLITGECLSLLPQSLEYLNISYCWSLKESTISTLVSSQCQKLKHLVANNFDFPSSDQSLTDICNKFQELQCLDMSYGKCTEREFHMSPFSTHGFSSIARLKQLVSLTIRKVCVLDDLSLLQIIQSCHLLRHLVIDMRTETTVTDFSITLIPKYSPLLETLEISGNRAISDSAVITAITGLTRLKKLFLFEMSVTDDVVDFVAKNCHQLRKLNVNRCHRISKLSLLAFIEKAKKIPQQKFHFEAINTRIFIKTVVKNRVLQMKDLPSNIAFKVSFVRGINYIWFNANKFGYSSKPQWL